MRTAARALVLTLAASLVLPAAPVHAEALSTEAAIAAEAPGQARDRLRDWLARADVQAALERHGVAPALAAQRVAALSDEEALALAGRVDSAPAGGSVLGAVVFVFLVLLVTDILGLTKVFPFTRSIR
ncbi:MAG TPA: PA2779 family protein [Moraxellaceae bacterium]|nr:PA2779 family protein [Moraxellaceae bacterium]